MGWEDQAQAGRGRGGRRRRLVGSGGGTSGCGRGRTTAADLRRPGTAPPGLQAAQAGDHTQGRHLEGDVAGPGGAGARQASGARARPRARLQP